MGSILIHTEDESVTLTAQAVRRLLERGDGDAALLYLALLRTHGTVQPRSLAGELRWERLRIEAAEDTLRELGLVAPAAEAPPDPADERPAYQRGGRGGAAGARADSGADGRGGAEAGQAAYHAGPGGSSGTERLSGPCRRM
ncbi:MAG: hypothetical protein V8R40_12535 [Dysosmobacter sp.]